MARLARSGIVSGKLGSGSKWSFLRLSATAIRRGHGCIRKRLALYFAVQVVLLLCIGCGGGSGTPVPAQALTITAQPSSQGVRLGHTATFSVAATGSGPITYQWTLN